MIIKKTLENTKRLLKRHNQSHLLAFWDRLKTVQKQNLLTQIEELDFSKIDNWVAEYIKNPASAAVASGFKPAPSYSPVPSSREQERKYARAAELGREFDICRQSGRLRRRRRAGEPDSDSTPQKGIFPSALSKTKRCYKFFAESIAAVSERYHGPFPPGIL